MLCRMRLVVQRVSNAIVTSRVGEPTEVRGAIGRGLVVLIGFTEGDAVDVERWAADRVAGLRVFDDEHGKMNLDVRMVAGGVAAVPNFTLAADGAKGRRPSFSNAMPAAEASARFDAFVDELRCLLRGRTGDPDRARPAVCGAATSARGEDATGEPAVVAGVFGSYMHIQLENDGPVTVVIDNPPRGAI